MKRETEMRRREAQCKEWYTYSIERRMAYISDFGHPVEYSGKSHTKDKTESQVSSIESKSVLCVFSHVCPSLDGGILDNWTVSHMAQRMQMNVATKKLQGKETTMHAIKDPPSVEGGEKLTYFNLSFRLPSRLKLL
jgi:hypothetical protein